MERRARETRGHQRREEIKKYTKRKEILREEFQLIIKKRLAPVGIKGSVKKMI